ncbi:MAG TPA: hypothetical protein VEH07_01530 [Alphaproteobacteria bacterium]|nr:hypothetical protein [Alphaproteobacteria bacterium]
MKQRAVLDYLSSQVRRALAFLSTEETPLVGARTIVVAFFISDSHIPKAVCTARHRDRVKIGSIEPFLVSPRFSCYRAITLRGSWIR